MQLLSCLITAASIAATIANVYKKRWCFTVWLFTNLFWCVYDAYIGAYAQSALFAVYFIISAVGLGKWVKDGADD